MALPSEWGSALDNDHEQHIFDHERGTLSPSPSSSQSESFHTAEDSPVTTTDHSPDVESSQDQNGRKCSVKTCRTLLGEDNSLKMCDSCRSKHRDYAKTKRARRKHEKQVANSALNGVSTPTGMFINPQLLGEGIVTETASTTVSRPPIRVRPSRRPPSPVSPDEERALMQKHEEEQERARAEVDGGPRRYCTIKGCKSLIPNSYLFKMCLKCRHKYRGYGTAKRAKWKEDRNTANAEFDKLRAEEDAKRASAGKGPLLECPEEWHEWEEGVIHVETDASPSPASPGPSLVLPCTTTPTENTTLSPVKPALAARLCTVSHCRTLLSFDYPYRRCDEHRLQNQRHGVLKRIRDKVMKAQALHGGIPPPTTVTGNDDLGGENAALADLDAPILPQPPEPPSIRGYRRTSSTCITINCQNILSNLEPWKTCEVCREEGREKRRRRENPEYQRRKAVILAEKEKKKGEDAAAEAQAHQEEDIAESGTVTQAMQLEDQGTEGYEDITTTENQESVKVAQDGRTDALGQPGEVPEADEPAAHFISESTKGTISDRPSPLASTNTPISTSTFTPPLNDPVAQQPTAPSLPPTAQDHFLDGGPSLSSPHTPPRVALEDLRHPSNATELSRQIGSTRDNPEPIGASQTFTSVFRYTSRASCVPQEPPRLPPPQTILAVNPFTSPVQPAPPLNQPLRIIMHQNQPPPSVNADDTTSRGQIPSEPTRGSKRIKFSTPLTANSMRATQGQVRKRVPRGNGWITTSSSDYAVGEPSEPSQGPMQPSIAEPPPPDPASGYSTPPPLPPPTRPRPPSIQHSTETYHYHYCYDNPSPPRFTPHTPVYQPWSESSNISSQSSYHTNPYYFAPYPPPPAAPPPPPTPQPISDRHARHMVITSYRHPDKYNVTRGRYDDGVRHAHVVPFTMPVLEGHYESESILPSHQNFVATQYNPSTPEAVKAQSQRCSYKRCQKPSRGMLCEKCKTRIRRRVESTKKRSRVVPKPGVH